ncbi:FixH family protein [Pelagibius sp.]|uniref:FixH family protein n=1 Tax=Pelagibius sp. TaxID=1931238 RepID=UPI003B505212
MSNSTGMESETMQIRGKHVLAGMLGFFGVIIAVNMVFVYLALDTFTGVTTDSAYRDGLNYNETLADRDTQRSLGWQAAVALTDRGVDGEELTVTLRDRDGTAVTGLTVTGVLKRPTHDGYDQPVTLAEAAPGEYVTDLALPLRGNWDLTLLAEGGRATDEGTAFEMKTRLWLK